MKFEKAKRNITNLIREGKFPYSIDDVYNSVGIFDWWKNTLSKADLENMLRFLNTAEKYGFTGKVGFKVGVTGCANGMWATRTDDPDSKDKAFLYRSFTTDYTNWDAMTRDGKFISVMSGKEFTRMSELVKWVNENWNEIL